MAGTQGRRSSRIRRLAAGLGAALVAAAALVAVPLATPAQAAFVYQVTNYDHDGTRGVYLRNSANIDDVVRDPAHYVTYGTSVELICAEFGSSVGPHANTAWDYVRVVDGPRAGTYGHLSEHWVNTPVGPGQHVSGLPACGSGGPPPPPPPSPGGSAETPIWVGAPSDGYWPGSPNPSDAKPNAHEPKYTISGKSYKGDWALDYYAVAGTKLYVYAAPKDGTLGSAVTAQVVKVAPACGSGVIGDGGYAVQVGLFHSGVRVGVVVYAHVNPDFNGDGVTNSADINFRGGISRWGGYLGTVGAYRRVSGGCWDVRTTGGQHVHMELSNERRYACYRPGMGDHAQLRTSNYLGYLGGNFASGRKAACPNGI